MNEPKRLLPEERELERLRLELESRVSLLADRELDVANTKSRLAVFERLYLSELARCTSDWTNWKRNSLKCWQLSFLRIEAERTQRKAHERGLRPASRNTPRRRQSWAIPPSNKKRP